MLKIKATGSIADMIKSVRGVPDYVIPYTTSTALTRVAKIAATKDLPAEMSRVFDRPVPYTLNSLFIEPATAQKLSARIRFKTQTSNSGTFAENFLLPNIEGGGRHEKRLEVTLRYSGVLPAGWRVVIGKDAPRDAFGNMPLGEIQRILTAIRANHDPAQNKTNSRRSRRNAKNAPYFVIAASRGLFSGGEYKTVASSVQPGIYRREGRRKIIPVLIFTKKQPMYKKIFDFVGTAERSTREHFPIEFDRAARDLLAKGAP